MPEFTNGFIKLYRQMLDWRWWEDVPTRNVFFYILLSSNFKRTSWRQIELLPGQVITSIEKLAQKTGFTPKQVRRALKNLVSTNEISKQTTNGYTVITVKKWSIYQDIQDDENMMCNSGADNGK